MSYAAGELEPAAVAPPLVKGNQLRPIVPAFCLALLHLDSCPATLNAATLTESNNRVFHIKDHERNIEHNFAGNRIRQAAAHSEASFFPAAIVA